MDRNAIENILKQNSSYSNVNTVIIIIIVVILIVYFYRKKFKIGKKRFKKSRNLTS